MIVFLSERHMLGFLCGVFFVGGRVFVFSFVFVVVHFGLAFFLFFFFNF